MLCCDCVTLFRITLQGQLYRFPDLQFHALLYDLQPFNRIAAGRQAQTKQNRYT